MKTIRFLALGLLLASHGSLHAATPPAGKTQQLTTPDQVPEGLAKSDWASIRAAYEAGQHAFQPIEGGWQARNPGQQWTTKFDRRGFLAQPRDADWQWGLELKSYGFEETQTAIGGTPAVKAEGQRLSYQWDATVQEWWVNDKRGLEHGFTVAKRPSLPASSSQSLSFTLAVRGTLTPKVSPDALGVMFQDAGGATVLNYTGLKVWDADGKILVSHFEPAGQNAVRLLVDDRAARYPITIDPIAQQAYVKPATNLGSAVEQDQFGHSVAVSGDTVVVGAPFEDSSTTGINSTPNESASAAGAAYVFVRSGATWSQQAYLKPAAVGTTQAGDEFGDSVAVSGDTVVVGARYEGSSTMGVNSTPDEAAPKAGAAYVFVRSGTTWSQQAYLKASQVTAQDFFGNSVAVSGDTVVVGAHREDSSTTGINSTPDEGADNAGAAYVFVRNGSMWSEQAYLKPAAFGSTQVNDFFGSSVAVDGDTVVVGALIEDSSTTGINSTPDEGASGAGAAYVFVRSGSLWSQQAYLKPAVVGTTQLGDGFGGSVAVSGDTVVVGAVGEDSTNPGINSPPSEDAIYYGDSAGAAYVFVRSGSTWSEQAFLTPAVIGTTQAGDYFGLSVAVSGDTVFVGALYEDSSTMGINSTPNEGAYAAGAAYAFVRSGATWSQQAYVKPLGTSHGGDSFGISVAVSGDTVVVGANRDASSTTGIDSTPNDLAGTAGAAYVFVRSGSMWSQQAYLKPAAIGTTQAGDNFGWSVAVSGDTVVVGAYGEDSSTTGINSTPDEAASFAGAAYVFVRNGTTWSEQAYIKPAAVGTLQAGDQFGYSVAVAGDTMVVGANREGSSTTGINSTPNESAGFAGAAYVFVRSGTTWSQQAYLKASQVTASDNFGSSVAVSSDTVVVGAIGEDSSTTGINSTPDEGASFAGAAYVFVRSGSAWSQQAYLKPADVGTTQVNDFFGFSVAVSDNTVVVGARNEDSSTTGINSTPDEGAADAGAAYVFVRSGSIWSQQAYLKPAAVGTSQAGDNFGYSVAMSGDTVVVGARYEGSSTTGINSTPDEVASLAGAAYVFVRNVTTWSEQAYLKASQVTASDQFGSSVAVSGGTAVVGAPFEDSSSTGINSTPNEGALSAGAASIFTGLGPLTPDIAVTQAAALADAGSIDFGPVTLGSSAPLTFTITNSGDASLTSLAVTKSGTYATDFIVSGLSGTSIPVGAGTVIFTVTFTPTGTVSATHAAALHIASNDPDAENPFDINLSGTVISSNTDGDGDGLNDLAEFQLSALGFDWQVGQTALVNTYYSSANAAGLYTPAQVQALNVGTPLIQRHPTTGVFTLTLGVEKSTTLLPGSFLPFPMTGVGTSTVINGQGKLEFQFTVPDNAAFFQLKAQ
jgi:hypothetical protein